MTVYGARYSPSQGSYPNGEILDGGTEIKLIDESPDGGVGIRLRKENSGRAVDPGSIPTVIRWPANRKPQDFETLFVRTVSDRFRILIEELEPGVHQFISLKYVRKSGDLIENRWFWQICNRIDSVFTERPGWVFNRVQWEYPSSCSPILKINKSFDYHFWHEKHLLAGILMSELAMFRLNEEDISGFVMSSYESIEVK